MLRAFGATDKGRVRPINEDCFAVDETAGLCVVADGMGGHNAGEVASRIAVDTVVDFVRRTPHMHWPFGYDDTISDGANALRTAIQIAHGNILEAAGADRGYLGMGTTIVAALVNGGSVTVAHVGDSRLYIAANGRVRQVTRDDSWVATMLAQDPDVDPRALQHHPMRNALTNVVGARAKTDVHVADEKLAGGELIVLTTDGVHAVLDDQTLEQMIGETSDPRSLATGLVTAALERGSRDNCTAVVAKYLGNGG